MFILQFYMTMLGMILFIIPAVIICACYSIIVSVIWSKGSVGSTSRPVTARRFNRANGITFVFYQFQNM
jgi:TRAP-type mannitol/chloroaromatic compound transport system permease small subunit